MLQIVATLISTLLALGALAVIAGVLADDWHDVARALGFGRMARTAPLPAQRPRSGGDRHARVVRVSPQSAPQRAAA